MTYGQLSAGRNGNAWQRTAYERWDSWRPWLYFTFTNPGYNNTDRRTMYSRMGAMTLWSAYADEYELHLRGVDSVLSQETYKALDKTLNKNWLVLQRPRALVLYDKIENRIEEAINGNVPPELYGIFQERYFDIVTDIEFIKQTYAPDAEKFPLLEEKIKNLEDLFAATQLIESLAILWDPEFADILEVDYSEQIDLQIEKVNTLITN